MRVVPALIAAALANLAWALSKAVMNASSWGLWLLLTTSMVLAAAAALVALYWAINNQHD